MAGYPLKNDAVVTIGILATDDAHDVVPAPANDAFSVVSSDPAKLHAAIGTNAAGHPAVIINALVRAATGLSFKVSDTAGLAAITQEVDIVDDTTPKAVGLDLAGAASAPQPVPPA